jgi:hypothetical protein
MPDKSCGYSKERGESPKTADLPDQLSRGRSFLHSRDPWRTLLQSESKKRVTNKRRRLCTIPKGEKDSRKDRKFLPTAERVPQRSTTRGKAIDEGRKMIFVLVASQLTWVREMSNWVLAGRRVRYEGTVDTKCAPTGTSYS